MRPILNLAPQVCCRREAGVIGFRAAQPSWAHGDRAVRAGASRAHGQTPAAAAGSLLHGKTLHLTGDSGQIQREQEI